MAASWEDLADEVEAGRATVNVPRASDSELLFDRLRASRTSLQLAHLRGDAYGALEEASSVIDIVAEAEKAAPGSHSSMIAVELAEIKKLLVAVADALPEQPPEDDGDYGSSTRSAARASAAASSAAGGAAAGAGGEEDDDGVGAAAARVRSSLPPSHGGEEWDGDRDDADARDGSDRGGDHDGDDGGFDDSDDDGTRGGVDFGFSGAAAPPATKRARGMHPNPHGYDWSLLLCPLRQAPTPAAATGGAATSGAGALIADAETAMAVASRALRQLAGAAGAALDAPDACDPAAAACSWQAVVPASAAAKRAAAATSAKADGSVIAGAWVDAPAAAGSGSAVAGAIPAAVGARSASSGIRWSAAVDAISADLQQAQDDYAAAKQKDVEAAVTAADAMPLFGDASASDSVIAPHSIPGAWLLRFSRRPPASATVGGGRGGANGAHDALQLVGVWRATGSPAGAAAGDSATPWLAGTAAAPGTASVARIPLLQWCSAVEARLSTADAFHSDTASLESDGLASAEAVAAAAAPASDVFVLVVAAPFVVLAPTGGGEQATGGDDGAASSPGEEVALWTLMQPVVEAPAFEEDAAATAADSADGGNPYAFATLLDGLRQLISTAHRDPLWKVTAVRHAQALVEAGKTFAADAAASPLAQVAARLGDAAAATAASSSSSTAPRINWKRWWHLPVPLLQEDPLLQLLAASLERGVAAVGASGADSPSGPPFATAADEGDDDDDDDSDWSERAIFTRMRTAGSALHAVLSASAGSAADDRSAAARASALASAGAEAVSSTLDAWRDAIGPLPCQLMTASEALAESQSPKKPAKPLVAATASSAASSAAAATSSALASAAATSAASPAAAATSSADAAPASPAPAAAVAQPIAAPATAPVSSLASAHLLGYGGAALLTMSGAWDFGGGMGGGGGSGSYAGSGETASTDYDAVADDISFSSRMRSGNLAVGGLGRSDGTGSRAAGKRSGPH